MAPRILLTLSLSASALYLWQGGVVWKGLSVSPLALLALLRRERLLAAARVHPALGA
jgi:hypothetical protein